jgi:hypothetical protein
MSKKRSYQPLEREQFTQLPGPLHTLLELYDQERNAFRKVHRLIDALEWAVKWHTVLAVSDLLREAQLTPRMKVLLAGGLRTPSLGMWNLFFREAVAALGSPSVAFSQEERLVLLESKHQIVSFRNGYAHGATPEEESCLADCRKMEPVLLQLIGSTLFTEIDLGVCGPDGAHILKGPQILPTDIELEAGHAGAVMADGMILDLWPLGLYAEDKQKDKGWSFYYFNAIKSEKVEQLNYEYASLLRDKELYKPFNKALPLKEWGKAEVPELDLFRARIEALTESFKGRTEERRRLKEFCLGQTKALVVWGVPGIGKSSLLAQTFKEIKAGISPEGEREDREYPPVIEYFIRRGDNVAGAEVFLRTMNRRFDGQYGLAGIPIGNSVQELWEGFRLRLDAVEEKEESGELVLFIDGLDESPELLRYIPEPRGWLKVMVAGRAVQTVTEWECNWGREGKEELEVHSLGSGDIRALLYEVADRYQEGFTAEYVQAVVERSEGNPLYLKLLCEKIFTEGGRLGETEELPADIAKLYEESVKRVSNGGKDEDVLSLLRLLTEAKASLSVPVIAEFLGRDSQRVRGAVDACRELLFEDPLTADVDDFQLFHESLREWLKNSHRAECRRMAEKLGYLCYRYAEREDKLAREYALTHASGHLAELGDHERLWLLLRDEEYRNEQVAVFKHYGAAYESLQNGIDLYVSRDGQGKDDDPRLCWLALRAGELVEEATSDIEVAFEWAEKRALDDPERMSDALQRLDFLAEGKFFKACILLLWIETERQLELPAASRQTFYVEQILDEIEGRREQATRLDREREIESSPGLMRWISNELWAVFPDLDLCNVLMVGMDVSDVGEYAVELVRSGNIDKPIALAVHLGNAPGNLSDIAYECHKAGQSGASEDLFGRVTDFLNEEEAVDSDDLVSICENFARVGEIAKAAIVARDIDVDVIRALDFTKICRQHAEDLRFDWAVQLAEIIDRIEEKCEAYCAVAEVLGGGADTARTSELLERASGLALEINDAREKAKATTKIARAYAWVGDQEKARALLDNAFDIVGEVEDEWSIDEVLEGMATLGVEIGCEEKAKLAAKRIGYDSSRHESAYSIAVSLAEGGKADEATTLIDESGADGYKPMILITIALRCAREDKLEESRHWIDEALDILRKTHSFKQNYSRSVLLPAIEQLVDMEEFDLALQLFEVSSDWEDKLYALHAVCRSKNAARATDAIGTTLERLIVMMNSEFANDEDITDQVFGGVMSNSELAVLADIMHYVIVNDASYTCDGVLEMADTITDDHIKSRLFFALADNWRQEDSKLIRKRITERAVRSYVRVLTASEDNVNRMDDVSRWSTLSLVGALATKAQYEKCLQVVGRPDVGRHRAEALSIALKKMPADLANGDNRPFFENIIGELCEVEGPPSGVLLELVEFLIRQQRPEYARLVVGSIKVCLEEKEAIGMLATTEKLAQSEILRVNKADVERVTALEEIINRPVSDLSFEDSINLDDRVIDECLQHIDTAVVAIALSGASIDLRNRIYRILSALAGTLLQEEIRFNGPVDLLDVIEAQDQIVSRMKDYLGSCGTSWPSATGRLHEPVDHEKAKDEIACIFEQRAKDGRVPIHRLASLASRVATNGEREVVEGFLYLIESADQGLLSNILPYWRYLLVDHCAEVVGILRRSLKYSHGDLNLARDGICALLAAHIDSNNAHIAGAIAKNCRSLGLGFLSEESCPAQEYSNLDTWINGIEDDDTRVEILGLAKRVERGRISEDDFDAEVADLRK